MAFKPEFGLKSNLTLILHHADHLASRIEHGHKEPKNIATPITQVKSSKPSIAETLSSIDTTVDDLFSDFFKK
jgi:hypothetical protein